MHAIEIRGDVVTTRVRSREHGRPEREWRTLNLLAAYAPGLAPRLAEVLRPKTQGSGESEKTIADDRSLVRQTGPTRKQGAQK